MIALLPYVRPIVLLVGSNVFMTTAWYGTFVIRKYHFFM